MIKLGLDQYPIILKIISFLFILQFATIVFGYNLEFQQYIVIVVILLSLTIVYFIFQLQRIRTRPLRTLKVISNVVSSIHHTNQEVKKLQDSDQYKTYQKKKLRQRQAEKQDTQIQEITNEQSDQRPSKNEELQNILLQLQGKQDEIFDF